jgi:hypothetical protein
VIFCKESNRPIYGPTKESDGTWRIKSNEELNRLIGNKNIVNYIKAQRLASFGHVHCMPDNSMVKKVYEWSPALTRSLGRPKNRWEDDVKSDNKYENNKLEELHQKLFQMERIRWEGQNFSEVVAP